MNRFFTLLFSILLFETTHAQNFQWAIPLGSPSYDGAQQCAVDAMGNVFVTGVHEGTMDMDPGNGVSNIATNGSMDVFVAGYTPAGQLLWAYTIGGSMYDTGAAIAVDNNNNVIVAGIFRGTVDFDPGSGTTSYTSAGDKDMFFVKFSNSGTFMWAYAVGGTETDEVNGITADQNNNIIACGLFTSPADFDTGAGVQNLTPTGVQDAFILKWDQDGNYIWAKRFGTSPGEGCYDVKTDSNGNVFATGDFYGNLDFDPNGGSFMLNAGNSYSQNFVLKWDADGNFIWAGMFGGSQSDTSYALDLDVTGNVFVTGHFGGTGDFDPGAAVFDLVSDNNGSYPDLFVLKLNNAGGFIWAKSIGVASFLQSGYDISVRNSGDCWVTGLYDGTVDFDPGAGVATLDDSGSGQVFILNLDADGNYVWASSIGGTQGDHGSGISVNESDVFLCGLYSWYDVDLDPTDGEAIYDSYNGASDGFILKLGTCTPPTLTTSSTQAICSDGTATVDATGNDPFTYLWNDANAQTTATAINLAPGDYSVTVTDNGGCSATALVNVPGNPCPGDFNGDQIVNVSDLLLFMPAFSCQGNCCPYDFDYNNVVNVGDMLEFMGAFGVTCQ